MKTLGVQEGRMCELRRFTMTRLPKSNKVVTVFINFKYKSRNKNLKFLHQNLEFVTNCEPIILTHKRGNTTLYQYMRELAACAP